MTIAAGEYTIIDFNDIEIAFEEPLNPPLNQVWLDVSTVPNILKRWDGEKWVKASPTTAAEIGAETPEGAQDKVDAVEVGGRNLLLDSGVEISNNDHLVNEYIPSSPLVAGETYVVTVCVTPAENVTDISVFDSQGDFRLAGLKVNGTDKQIVSKKFVAGYADGKTPDDSIDYANVLFYRSNEETHFLSPMFPAGFADMEEITSDTTIHWVKLEKGNKATDWTPAPEDAPTSLYELDPDAQESLDSHNAAISVIETGFVQLEDSIGTKVSQTDFDEFGNLINQQVSAVEQTQDAINMEFSQISENITNIDGEVEQIKTGIRFDEAGMHIGKSDSPLQMTLSNEQLAFLDNEQLVAYVNGQKLYITMAEILESLVVGNHKIEKYDDEITLIRWVG